MQQSPSSRLAALEELKRLGGRLTLDFVNTVDPREGSRTRDFLCDYVDFALWAAEAGATSKPIATRLIESAAAAGRGEAVFNRAVALRETLYRILTAEARSLPPRQADLDSFQAELHGALAHLVLERETGYGWGWDDDGSLERPLWAILWDAAELLRSPELRRVKLCPGRDCGWLFLDRSKNQSRRWCSMDTCGSREKMRRLHARRRAR
jgi:predicted RNA-binding Zn ribbon-like protein